MCFCITMGSRGPLANPAAPLPLRARHERGGRRGGVGGILTSHKHHKPILTYLLLHPQPGIAVRRSEDIKKKKKKVAFRKKEQAH
jgi:hypothetical protein